MGISLKRINKERAGTMKTKISEPIKIVSNDKLLQYTHSVGEMAAKELRDHIYDLQHAGYWVIDATSTKATVPNKYKWPDRMHAPYYRYDAETEIITLVDGKLESRSYGSYVPIHLIIRGQRGDKIPTGYHCIRYMDGKNKIDIVPSK